MMFKRSWLALLLLKLALLTGCAFNSDPPAKADTQPVVPLQDLPGAGGYETAKQIGTITDPQLKEVSGLAASRVNKGVWWVHNDSGNEPVLFCLDQNFKLLTPQGIRLQGAHNWDWEDIAYHPGPQGGEIWVADSGNNFNLPTRKLVYRCSESDLESQINREQQASVPCNVLTEGVFERPWWHWANDSEALLCWHDQAYLVSKNRTPFRLTGARGQAQLYRLQGATWPIVSHLKYCAGWITAADLSQAAGLVALLTHLPSKGVVLFRLPVQGDDLFSQPSAEIALSGLGQCEALCFADPDHLVITNEQGQVFQLDISAQRRLLLNLPPP